MREEKRRGKGGGRVCINIDCAFGLGLRVMVMELEPFIDDTFFTSHMYDTPDTLFSRSSTRPLLGNYLKPASPSLPRHPGSSRIGYCPAKFQD